MSTHGRWTIIRQAAPAQRRPSETHLRARVLARCVCGRQKTLWVEDLDAGRSMGCKSPLCRARWEASNAMKAALDKWLVEAGQRDMALPDLDDGET